MIYPKHIFGGVAGYMLSSIGPIVVIILSAEPTVNVSTEKLSVPLTP